MKNNKFWNYGYKIGKENGKLTKLDRLIQSPYFLVSENASDKIATTLLSYQIAIPYEFMEEKGMDNKDLNMFILGYNSGKTNSR